MARLNQSKEEFSEQTALTPLTGKLFYCCVGGAFITLLHVSEHQRYASKLRPATHDKASVSLSTGKLHLQCAGVCQCKRL